MQIQWYRSREDPEPADSLLVQQALSGDQDAFEVLVSRYKQSLFGLIYYYVGEYHEEVTKEVPTLCLYQSCMVSFGES